MRIHVDVSTDVTHIAWPDVHGPARGLLYGLLKGQDPALAAELHDIGWQGHSLRPLGMSPPTFKVKQPHKGVYAASSDGSLWMGSPVPRIAGCLLAALTRRRELRWGSTKLTIRGVQLDATPDHSNGEAVFETLSPLILRHENRFLLPEDTAYVDRLLHNLRHKADVLDLPHDDLNVEVLAIGRRRRFDVQKTLRIGATARLRLQAPPALLDALHSWGLGLNTNQGFGWIR